MKTYVTPPAESSLEAWDFVLAAPPPPPSRFQNGRGCSLRRGHLPELQVLPPPSPGRGSSRYRSPLLTQQGRGPTCPRPTTSSHRSSLPELQVPPVAPAGRGCRLRRSPLLQIQVGGPASPPPTSPHGREGEQPQQVLPPAAAPPTICRCTPDQRRVHSRGPGGFDNPSPASSLAVVYETLSHHPCGIHFSLPNVRGRTRRAGPNFWERR